ncbi:PP2C family protein-serine/threonine phosphatase [Leekyejoonella antrihumi]|uniref:Serine/threonine-protein phosphatase n=1 Tax=Leekyejoonella antrihumi TaxID=1660198 RepID=A0A563E7P9_9MICO|nr:protein phosphatase 2C domain-containing protein [Leekyejoonella antrihumi]TWP38231.1 serine/threonine-protein phosphatase [Leekyejoonella antrihumi]
MAVALRYAARTDLGLGSKTRNEDSAYAGPDLLVLADGMGGHAAGDLASSTVVAELVHLDGEDYGADEALQRLAGAVADANQRLRDEMDENTELEGMGTTLVAFLRTGSKLAMANIGDSRAYLLRDGVFTQITKDHSFVQALLDDGRITPQEAEHHPQRNLVARVLTGRADDEPDLSMREAHAGDRYLLCCDGLSDYVAAATIEEIVGRKGPPGDIADALIAIALKASARDNVTVVVADVVPSDEPTSHTPQVVGAASARAIGLPPAEPSQPRTPAEKAAALTREANPPAEPPEEDEPTGPVLAEEGPHRFRLLRRLGILALVITVVAVGAWLGYAWTQRQYYVAAHNGMVTIYQGVPENLGPISLHSVNITSDVALTDLPNFYQTQIEGTLTADSKQDAIRIVEQMRMQMVKCQMALPDGSSCTQ